MIRNISLVNITNRNTEARVVEIGDVELFFSYDTLIGVRAPGELRGRRANDWGPTTGRHIREMGLQPFPIYDANALHELATLALRREAKS